MQRFASVEHTNSGLYAVTGNGFLADLSRKNPGGIKGETEGDGETESGIRELENSAPVNEEGGAGSDEALR